MTTSLQCYKLETELSTARHLGRLCYPPATECSIKGTPHLHSHAVALLLWAGLADPVYAEAYVTVHQYDIVLDVTVINRTDATMQVGTRVLSPSAQSVPIHGRTPFAGGQCRLLAHVASLSWFDGLRSALR